MEKLVGIGRLFFAIALIAFGAQHFIYGDFVPGRAPAWPAALPGRVVWASLSGALLIGAGAAIGLGRKARAAAVLVGTLILVWALLRHLPELVANPHGVVLTNTGKALALFGGAFAVAGSFSAENGRNDGAFSAFFNARDGFTYLGRCCLGSFMILATFQHFIYAQFVATLVPAWIPGPYFWTYFAAIALFAGGVGLFIARVAPLAAAMTGVMLFVWVLILHIPRAVAAAPAQSRNEWTAVFEALAMAGIAFVLAGILSDRRPSGSVFRGLLEGVRELQ